MKTAVLVLAAGRGARLGHALPKAFVELGGRSLVRRSIDVMLSLAEVAWVQPIVARADLERCGGLNAAADPRVRAPVPGGKRRQDSVAAGLAALPADVECVAVHDAARCLVAAADVRRVICLAWDCGAALLAAPATDTIKRVRDARVVETPPRSECWVAQTPQVFRVDWLREAHARARSEQYEATDDAELVERIGRPVCVLEASAPNPKITRPEDLEHARIRLREAAGEVR